MEKKSNSTSSRTRSSSICSRIRQALASYPAFRTIRHINQYNNKPEPPNHHHHNNKPTTITTTTHSNNPPSSSPTKHIAKNTASVFQSNPPLHQHVKVMMNTEGRGEGALIPINFDYSTTTPPPPPPPPSSSSLSISKVTSPQPRKGHHHGLGMQHSSEQQQQEEEGGKKSLDINDTFAEYIQRTKNNFRRSASNVGPSQGNSATISHHEANDISANNTNAIKMENQKDPFSDFIQRSGKRLRTTSNVAKVGGSFKRG